MMQQKESCTLLYLKKKTFIYKNKMRHCICPVNWHSEEVEEGEDKEGNTRGGERQRDRQSHLGTSIIGCCAQLIWFLIAIKKTRFFNPNYSLRFLS